MIILFRTTFPSLSTPRLTQQLDIPYLSPHLFHLSFLYSTHHYLIFQIFCVFLSLLFALAPKNVLSTKVEVLAILIHSVSYSQHVWYIAGPQYTLAE